SSSISYLPTHDGCSIRVTAGRAQFSVPVLLLPRVLHGRCTVSAGKDAFYILKLNRGVPDLKARAQNIVDALQNRIAFRRRHIVDQDVAAEGTRVRSQAPYMEVMNVDDALDTAQLSGDILQFEAFGQTFQKDIERIANDIPAGPNDGHADQD